MDDLPDGSVDMVLCDLPYGITRAEWDRLLPFDRLWAAYRRVLKDDGACVLFASGRFGWRLPASNPRDWRYDIVWCKTEGTDFLNANRKPLNAHEHIHVFYRRQPTYNPQKTHGHDAYRTGTGGTSELWGKFTKIETVNDGSRFPTTLLTFPNENGRHGHSTGKPVPLLEWLIRTYTNPGETVLDNTMGSGSTGVAAINAGRRFIGMELDQEFYETARRRIDDAIQQNQPS